MDDRRIELMVAAYRHAMTGSGRQIRHGCGLTLDVIAGSVGVTESTLSRWETGQRRPTGESAIRWADLLESLQEQVASA